MKNSRQQEMWVFAELKAWAMNTGIGETSRIWRRERYVFQISIVKEAVAATV